MPYSFPAAYTSLLDRIPEAERTVPAMLRRAARLAPDRPFLDAPGGRLTYRELHSAARSVAGGMAARGMTRGDVTAVVMPNRVEYPVAWWAQTLYGGIAALVHPEYRGAQLTRALEQVRPRALVIDTSIASAAREELASIRSVELVIVAGEGQLEPWDGPAFVRWADLRGEVPEAPIAPADAATIMYTSGTSGGSKAVLRSHHFDWVYAALNADGHRHDETVNLFSPSTACHARTGICVLYAALIVLGRATITSGFSARRFWDEQVSSGATHAFLSGSIVNILMKAPAAPRERAHQLRTIQSLPAPLDPPAVEARFGCRVSAQGYGSTEAYPCPPQVLDQDWGRPLNCIGRVHPLMEVRLADGEGGEVAWDGVARGEILTRSRLPNAIMSGYHGDPEATERALAGGWFHTGDIATGDASGHLYFHGRATDTIRRRGENISAVEVEQAAMDHPAVVDCAAYGVPAELGEEDVKLDAILDPAAGAFTEADLTEFLAARLPRWAVPRYIELVPEFPRTATFKIQKSVLRSRPLGPGVYDRERE